MTPWRLLGVTRSREKTLTFWSVVWTRQGDFFIIEDKDNCCLVELRSPLLLIIRTEGALSLPPTYDNHPPIQSRKNPVSASAMLTGKFLQIRKVFATSSLLVEEFPDTLQYKISR